MDFDLLKLMYSKNKWQIILIVFLFLILFLFSAFRVDVGTDYKNYEIIFYDYLDIGDLAVARLEPGFQLTFKIVSFFSDDSRLFFVLTSFLILFFNFWSFLKYSRSVFLSIFLFVTLYYYFNSLNAVRQFLAMSLILCFSTRFISNRNMFKYMVSIVFASLFHTSALVMIPAYWLNKKLRFGSLFLVLLSIPLVFLSYDFFVGVIFGVLPVYDVYTDYQAGSASTFIIIQLAFLMLAFMAYKRNQSWTKEELISFNLSIFSIFLLVLSYKNTIFIRLGMYFGMYFLILIPAVLSSFSKSFESKFIFYCVCIILGLFNLVYHLYMNVSEVLPFAVDFGI